MGKKILIVDDEELIRNLLKIALTGAGYEVEQVDDGMKCTDAAILEQPDLIVMDINMPGMNGIEAIKKLKSNPTTVDIPILVMTGNATHENIMNAIKAGAADAATKAQARIEEVIERIENILEKEREKREQEEKTASEPKVKEELAPGEKPILDDNPPEAKEAKPEKKDVDRTQLMNQAVFESRMDTVCEVKTLPFVAKQVMSMANSSVTSTEELVNEIHKDPSLAAKVLRLSNSAYYAVAGRITSLAKAINTIGRRSIGELAASVSILDTFLKPETEGGLDRLRFWEHCFCCASIARKIAKSIKYKDEETMFLSGLFHNLGIAIFDDYFHEEFNEVLKKAAESDGGLGKWEKAIIGHSHMEVGSAILKNWGLSPEIIRPIFLYKDSFESMKMLPSSATILKLADIFAEVKGFDIGIDESIFFIPKETLEELGVSDEILVEIFAKIEDDMRDLRFAFFMYDTSKAASYYEEEEHDAGKEYVTIFREEFYLTDPVEILLRTNKVDVEIENSLALPRFLSAEKAIVELTTPIYLNKAIEPIKKFSDVNPMRRPPMIILVAEPLREAAERLIPKTEGITLLIEPFAPAKILKSLKS